MVIITAIALYYLFNGCINKKTAELFYIPDHSVGYGGHCNPGGNDCVEGTSCNCWGPNFFDFFEKSKYSCC